MLDDVIIDEKTATYRWGLIATIILGVIILLFSCGTDPDEPAAFNEPQEFVHDYVDTYIGLYGKNGARAAFEQGSVEARLAVLDQLHYLYQKSLADSMEENVLFSREDIFSYMLQALKSSEEKMQLRGAQYLYQDMLLETQSDIESIIQILPSASLDTAKTLWTAFTHKNIVEVLPENVLLNGLDSECGDEAMLVLYAKYPRSGDASFDLLHNLLLSSNLAAVRWSLRKLAYEYNFAEEKPTTTSVDDALRRLDLLSNSTAFGKLHSFEKRMISVLKPKLLALSSAEPQKQPLPVEADIQTAQSSPETKDVVQEEIVEKETVEEINDTVEALEPAISETTTPDDFAAVSDDEGESIEGTKQPENMVQDELVDLPVDAHPDEADEADEKPEVKEKVVELVEPPQITEQVEPEESIVQVEKEEEIVPSLEEELEDFSEESKNEVVEQEEDRSKTDETTRKNIELSWVGLTSDKELFSIEDIEAFDWEKQVFRLKLASTVKLLADSRSWGDSESFAVKDGVQTIYEGILVTSRSTKPFVGPTIHLDRHGFDAAAVAPPLFEIRGGYLGRYNDDEWNRKNGMGGIKNTFLHYMLKDAGVLRNIDASENEPVKMITTAIKFGNPQALLAGVQVYLDTFIIGEKALFHVMFKRGEYFPKKAHSLEFLVTLNSNDQRFGAQIPVKKVPLDILEKGYLCEFAPWNSNVILKGVDPQPGPAEFSVMVILNDEKGNPLTFCEIPSMSVEIHPEK